jgi:hypothetical protein
MARISEWFHRYAVAEVVGLVCALAAGIVAGRTAGAGAAAVAATLAEGVGFYGVILLRDVRRHGGNWRVARGLVVEFGFAEVADTLLVRPLAIYGATMLAGDTVAGVLIGKVAADIFFYGAAIAGYELRKRLDGRPADAPAVADRVDGQPTVAPAGAMRVAGQPAFTGRVDERLAAAPTIAGHAAMAPTVTGRLYGQPAVAGRVDQRPADASVAYGRWAAGGRVDGHATAAVRIA